jgi:uncharacterized protein
MRGSNKSYSIAEIREKLSPLFQDRTLQVALLFGSVASGRNRRQSDIDLGFLFEGAVDILDLTNQVIRLLQTDCVDVVDLRRASPLLKFSAAKEGKILHERSPGLFNAFYSLALRRYIDTKKIRDAQRVTLNHFLEEKGLR